MDKWRMTLQELINMLQSLPESVKAKEIGYLDLGHMTKEDLDDLKKRLTESDNEMIEQCCNQEYHVRTKSWNDCKNWHDL